MRVRLLGALSVRHQEAELPLGGSKQRAVLALLALDANRIVSVDRLIAEVWPEEPPAQATVALRSYISRLRRVLAGTGAEIETRPPGWLLRVDAEQVDAVRFVRLVVESRRAAEAGDQPHAVVDRLREALDLWDGEPLADLADLESARVQAVRLGHLREEAGELLLEARLAAGEQAGVIEAARDLVDAHPYRERAWCVLMTALYRQGRQSEAVAAYAELRRLLRDELGLDPSPQARELEAQILRQDPALQPPAVARSRGAGPVVASVTTSAAGADLDDEEAPLEGRAEVRAQLAEAWDGAAAGSGGLLLLEASAGAGKSAVLRALVHRVRSSGGRALAGNGVGDDVIPALWPWVTIVRQLLAEVPELTVGGVPSGPAALAVATLGTGSGSEVAEDTQLARTTLYRGVVDLLLAARRRGPLALVIDDLQWVDRDSLTLLGLVVDQLAPAGVLFAVAVRPEEANVAAVDRMIDTLDRDLVTRVGLAPLAAADVAALTSRLAGQPAEPGLVAALTERTAGNPLFVTELVRLLVAEQQLTEPAARRALPAGVRDVLQRRIDRLPRETIGLLGVAALVAPSVLDVELLADVTGRSEDDVLDDCETGLLSGLLVENGDGLGTFGLSHDLVRQTLVGGLSDARRVRLHARVAASLQRRPTTSSEQIVEIARQLTLAAPAVGAAAAVPYLISASEDALSRYAHESAEATLMSALAAAGSIGDPVRRHAMELQVKGLLSGLQTLARATMPPLSARDEAPQLPQPTDARSAAGWLGVVINASTTGRYDWGNAAAREVLDRSPTQSAEIAARFVLGWLGFVQGDLDVAEAEFGVLDAMTDRGIDIALPGALSHLPETVAGYDALIAHARGDEDRASALISVARRRARGSDTGLLNAVLYDCLLAAMRGDRASAAEHAALSRRISERVEYPVYAIVTGVVGAWSRDLTGDPGESVDEAYTTYAATGIRTHAPTFLLLKAEVHEAAGDHVGAVELVRESRHLTARVGEVCVSPRLTALADRLLAGSGEGTAGRTAGATAPPAAPPHREPSARPDVT